MFAVVVTFLAGAAPASADCRDCEDDFGYDLASCDRKYLACCSGYPDYCQSGFCADQNSDCTAHADAVHDRCIDAFSCSGGSCWDCSDDC